MPEIAEVARIVYYLNKNLVGKVLKTVTAQDDQNVFGKVGTSGAEFEEAMTKKKIISAGQQGKYFWLLMDSPPHPVFHFGMTGWFHIRGEPVAHYHPRDVEEVVWPPKYWKFTMETEGEPKVEAAFTDARRFGRVRLVHCAAEDIRKTTPLKENGPDPVIDREILTEEWLEKKMKSKHVPVKALLLDQANISGIGNWVGDEILYNAKLHPEQYSDTFNSEQLKQLHTSMMYVCKTAVDLLADSSKFPDEWLFKHRWGKGKQDAPTTLPNGAKITFLTVGGRTSCVVPSIQKKTGAVAADVKTTGIGIAGTGEEGNAAPRPKKRKGSKKTADEVSDVQMEPRPSKAVNRKGRKIKAEGIDTIKPTSKKRKVIDVPPKKDVKEASEGENAPSLGRRRSGRISKGPQ